MVRYFSSNPEASSKPPGTHFQGQTGSPGRLTISVPFSAKEGDAFRPRREEGNVIVDMQLAPVDLEGGLDRLALYVEGNTHNSDKDDVKEVGQKGGDIEDEMAQTIKQFMDVASKCRLDREECLSLLQEGSKFAAENLEGSIASGSDFTASESERTQADEHSSILQMWAKSLYEVVSVLRRSDIWSGDDRYSTPGTPGSPQQ